MPKIQPGVADLTARFPTFAAVPAPTLAAALAEAAIRVDTTWTDGDYALGLMLYAAHVLTLDGQGTGAESALGAAGALGFTHLQSGPLTLARGNVAGPDAASAISATTYGRRYLALLRANKPAVLVP